MPKKKPQILLTNDDGIDSPGLWSAAEALSEIGYVWVVAPREQASSTGRSKPLTSDGLITPRKMTVNGKEWTVYAVGGSPTQAVEHGILEILGEKPDLVVSGINYGLNMGYGVTISGTVGAAMEAAALGVPSMAVSLETGKKYHLSYSKEIDFKPAGFFTAYFARKYLNGNLDKKVHVIKIEIPSDATPETAWEITRLSPYRYYLPIPPKRSSWDEPARVGYTIPEDLDIFPQDSDVYCVLVKRRVAVTPLTLEMTAPVDFEELDKELR